jgi:hypothetical protein
MSLVVAQLSDSVRVAIVEGVLYILELGAKMLNNAPVTKFVEFLRANKDVILELIPWLFSNSGQQPMFATDSPVVVKAIEAGLEPEVFTKFLATLQSAVKRVTSSDVAEFRVEEFDAAAESAACDKHVSQMVIDAATGEPVQDLQVEPSEDSPMAKELEARNFSFVDLWKYVPLFLQILDILKGANS